MFSVCRISAHALEFRTLSLIDNVKNDYGVECGNRVETDLEQEETNSNQPLLFRAAEQMRFQ
jgi:hypothetical protein